MPTLTESCCVFGLQGLRFKKFPYILTLQLKRFIFDLASMRRTKVNDKWVTLRDMLPLPLGLFASARPLSASVTRFICLRASTMSLCHSVCLPPCVHYQPLPLGILPPLVRCQLALASVPLLSVGAPRPLCSPSARLLRILRRYSPVYGLVASPAHAEIVAARLPRSLTGLLAYVCIKHAFCKCRQGYLRGNHGPLQVPLARRRRGE